MNSEKVSRSEFLRNGLKLFLKEAKTSVHSYIDKNIYPPCSGQRDNFLKKCNGCEACIIACPHHSLTMKEILPSDTTSIPVIEPELNPCYMCDNLPCVNACETGALSLTNTNNIGLAAIKQKQCFAHNGQVCDYCFDHCPLKNEAITMNNRVPVVNKDICTGCGMCVYYCPAPGKGIVILPKHIKDK